MFVMFHPLANIYFVTRYRALNEFIKTISIGSKLSWNKESKQLVWIEAREIFHWHKNVKVCKETGQGINLYTCFTT